MSLFEALFGKNPPFDVPIPDPPAPKPQHRVKPDDVQRVTVQRMIDKKTGVIRMNGKAYKFTIAEVEVTSDELRHLRIPHIRPRAC